MTIEPEFKIAYDGAALTSHSMDVKDLAPALLAFGALCDEANRVLNGDRTIINLQVKATDAGSFDIVFHLHQSFGSQITNFLSGEYVTSAANLIELLGFGAACYNGTPYSLLSLIKRLQGKNPLRIKELKDGMVQVEMENETIVIPIELLRLYRDVAVRRATQDILEPLKKEGIDTFKVLDKHKNPHEIIEKKDVSLYDLPVLEDELILDMTNDAAYSIISLAFKEDNKWRLFDGSATISANILDIHFLKQVEENKVSFSKGDILICSVRTKQFKTVVGQLKTEYDVLKVKEHRPALRQMVLFETDIQNESR